MRSGTRTMSMDAVWKQLSCPSLWEESNGLPCIPMPLSVASNVFDELDASPTPWHRVLDMISVAYAYCTHKRQADAIALLRDCYVYLLPQPYCQHDCALLKQYRPAMRHVLDSFWAVLEWGRTEATTPSPMLLAFINTITPFQHLSPDLQAAVHAIHGGVTKIQHDVALSYLERCIMMNRLEGEWHWMKGNSFWCGDSAVEHLRMAHRLRPGPHTALTLAENLPLDKCRAEVAELLGEVLRLYPDHPYVLSHAGRLLLRVHGKTKTMFAEAERLLLRCRAAIGDRCFLRLRLGYLIQEQGGRADEAKRHYETACRLNPADAGNIRMNYMGDYSNCVPISLDNLSRMFK
ncbi:uncharacterized protein LOC117643724 isoform X2 [Thrips palmi]|uniref:Uncharacterized protein LOC117643724 isoform X2 n=1 Tax=Thrips palmi TaxID=161013 RepID=A0A6P8YWV8_THRPL|nr:uncharacterized protein LOC117643724 isoform X2 [Thrips palmi]